MRSQARICQQIVSYTVGGFRWAVDVFKVSAPPGRLPPFREDMSEHIADLTAGHGDTGRTRREPVGFLPEQHKRHAIYSASTNVTANVRMRAETHLRTKMSEHLSDTLRKEERKPTETGQCRS